MSNNINPAGHLLFTNATTWCKTGREFSAADAAKRFERDKMTYCIYYVPLPPGTPYEIDFYAPQVDGARMLEMVEFKNGRKVKRATATEGEAA